MTVIPGEPATLSHDEQALADGHHLARGAAANFFVLLAANFRGVFTFLIARLLGEAALGRFGLTWAATDLLTKAGTLGFDGSIVPLLAPQAVAGDRKGCERIFRTALEAATLCSAALTLVAIAVAVWLARRGQLDAFANGESLMFLSLVGFAVARISTGVSRSVLSMRDEFYSRGLVETWVTTAVFVCALALGIRDRAPALAIVGGVTAGAFVAWRLASRALTARVALRPDGPSGHSAVDLGRMLRFSLPTAGSSLLVVLVLQADVLLLGAYVNRAPGVTAEAFGIFVAAAEIAGGLRKVRQVFDPIFATIVATRAVSEQRETLRATVAGPGRWVLAAQLPLVGGLLLSSGFVISIYGQGFRQGALWLALLGFAHGANSFAGLVETLLMVERPMLNLINAAITLAVQVITGVLLIPIFGVTGAALSMCLGFTVQGVLRFAELKHVFGWSWPWKTLMRPVTVFFAAFVPAAAIRVGFGPAGEIPAGLLFLGSYAAAWLVLGAEPEDRLVWRRLLKRN